MTKCQQLSDDDLLLAIERARVAIEGQKLVLAKLVAGTLEFQDTVDNRELVDTHILTRAMQESDLRDLEAEWQRRHDMHRYTLYTAVEM